MKNGWPSKPLGEVCENLDSKRVPITKSKRRAGKYPYYGASGVVDHVADYLFDEELLLVSEDGANLLARTYPIAFSVSGKIWVNNHAHVLKFPDSASQRFVEFYLNSIPLDPFVNGMAQPKLNQKALNSIPVPTPPLPEQRRIVGILDEAFAGIATAKAHAEQNLQNARALFESHLNAVFTQRGDGWRATSLGKLCTLVSGRHIAAKDYNNNSVGVGYLTGPADFGNLNPVISKWTEHPQAFAQRGDILITVKGAGVGKLNLLDAESVAISRQLMAIRVTGADPSFVYAFLDWNFEHFQSLGTGATVPGLSREDILDLEVPLPTESEQKHLVEQLDSLHSKTQRLESIYQRKLAALDELKKSLLHQAFSGELTGSFAGPEVTG